MDWSSLRRIITQNDADGRSSIQIDGGAAKVLAVEETGLAEIWAAALTRDGFLSGADRLADDDVQLEPNAGDVKVRWFTVPVEDPEKSAAEKEVAAAFGFAMCGAPHARGAIDQHPMMHATDTLDVIIVIRGEIRLLLNDGEAKSLRQGDVVIQRGTDHAWINEGSETALCVAVLIRPEAA
ncbi:MAG: cupin domain-containing protein [Pseudomonadota bacterium]